MTQPPDLQTITLPVAGIAERLEDKIGIVREWQQQGHRVVMGGGTAVAMEAAHG